MLKIVKQEAEYSSLNFHLLLSDRFDSVKTGHILKRPTDALFVFIFKRVSSIIHVTHHECFRFNNVRI